MRFLLVRLPEDITDAQRDDVRSDLFSDVKYIDCGNSDVVPTELMVSMRSEAVCALNLPQEPTVLLLDNYSGYSHFEVDLRPFNENQPAEFISGKILIFCNKMPQPGEMHASQRGERGKEIQEPSQAVEEHEIANPILTTICQHLAFEFSVMDLFLYQISSCINISGKSRLLECMPDFYCTSRDFYLEEIYDCDAASPQMNAYYHVIMNKFCPEEQESIAVVVGAMIDSISVIFDKNNECNECEDTTILPASNYLYFEARQPDLELPQIRGFEAVPNNCMQEYSIFDMYDRTIYTRLKSPAARYYTELAFDAYINYNSLLRVNTINLDAGSESDPGCQTPRTVMLRRSAFAELIRMFMNDCGDEAMGLVNAESSIRKTILLHLRHISPDNFFVNLTDELTDFDTDSISVIKLGARKEAKKNILAVQAELRLGELLPCDQHDHYDSIGNNICFVQKPRTAASGADGVVEWRQDEAYVRAKNYVANEFAKIAANENISFAISDLYACAPTFTEFYQVLGQLSIVQERVKEEDVKKKSETVQVIGCNSIFLDDSDMEGFMEQIQSPHEKGKAAQATTYPVAGNPFSENYKSHVFAFIKFTYNKIIIETEEAAEEERDDQLEAQICSLYKPVEDAFASSEGPGLIEFLGEIACIQHKKVSECVEIIGQETSKTTGKTKMDPAENMLLEDLCQLNPYVAMGSLLAHFYGDEQTFFCLTALKERIEQEIEPIYVFSGHENVTFLHEPTTSRIKDVLLQLFSNDTAFVSEHLRLRSAGSVFETTSNRRHASYSIMTSDRSVLNVYPDTSRIELFRKWNSLQESIHGYDCISSEFTDCFEFTARVYDRIETFNCESACFSANMPITSKLTGELQDASIITSIGDEFCLRKNSSSILISLDGKMTFNRLFQGTEPLICGILLEDSKQLECELSLPSIMIGNGKTVFFKAPDLTLADMYEYETAESSKGGMKNTDDKIAKRIAFLRQIVYNNSNLESVPQSSAISVNDTIEIPGLVSVTQIVFEKESLPLPFPHNATSCSVIELPVFGWMVFVFVNEHAIICIAEDGDVVYYSNQTTYVLKEDGSFFAHFLVETADNGREFWPLNKPETPLPGAHDKKSEKAMEESETATDTSLPASYTSPIILYGGEGFHFWHSILERRKKFMSNADLTSRLCFEEKAPVLKNRELLNDFQLLEPFELLANVVQQCKNEYLSLVALPTYPHEVLQEAELSFPRIHHELFLPVSNICRSTLSGVYRFILGTHNAEVNTPFYPSVSTIDWNGNTIHLRLGSPHENVYNVRPQASRDSPPPKEAGKQVARPESTVPARTRFFSQTSCEPVLPPLICETIHTDVVGEIDKLIEKRENAAVAKMQHSEGPECETVANEAIKFKKELPKKKKEEEEQLPPAIEDNNALRDLDSILNELEHIDVATVVESFKEYVIGLFGQTSKHLLGKRDLTISYDGDLFDDFIKQAIPNTDYPSPISPIMCDRYIIVPASPDEKYYKGDESYDYSSHSFCTIENDVPWMVLSNKEIAPLLFFTELLQFENITNFYTFTHQYVTRISSRSTVSEIPGYSYQPAIKHSLLQFLLAIKPLPEAPQFSGFLQQFDATYPYQEVQQHENYVQIFNFAAKNDVASWRRLEITKRQWREITRNREELIELEKSRKTRPLDGYIINIIKDLIKNEKIERAKQLEQEKTRAESIEIEKKRQELLTGQAERPREPKEYDRLIDKPLNNQRQHRPKDAKFRQTASPFSSPRGESDDVEDDDNIYYYEYKFGLETIINGKADKHLRAAREALGTVRALPKIGAAALPGALSGLLKIMPATVCCRCDINCISVKNVADVAVSVRVEADSSLIGVADEEIKLRPNQLVVVEIRHLAVQDSAVRFVTTGVGPDGGEIGDVQVVESKVKC